MNLQQVKNNGSQDLHSKYNIDSSKKFEIARLIHQGILIRTMINALILKKYLKYQLAIGGQK